MGTIKGTTVNSLGYTGIVTLSQYIRGKKFIIAQTHNAGGKPLFDFLADCLAGDFAMAELNRPNKILLLNIQDTAEGQDITKLADTGFISLLTKPERVYDAKEGIVRFSFIVPQDIFASAMSKFNAIGLYTASATTLDVADCAAICRVDQDFFDKVAVSSVLVLDWELHISNAPTGSPEQ